MPEHHMGANGNSSSCILFAYSLVSHFCDCLWMAPKRPWSRFDSHFFHPPIFDGDIPILHQKRQRCSNLAQLFSLEWMEAVFLIGSADHWYGCRGVLGLLVPLILFWLFGCQSVSEHDHNIPNISCDTQTKHWHYGSHLCTSRQPDRCEQRLPRETLHSPDLRFNDDICDYCLDLDLDLPRRDMHDFYFRS